MLFVDSCANGLYSWLSCSGFVHVLFGCNLHDRLIVLIRSRLMSTLLQAEPLLQNGSIVSQKHPALLEIPDDAFMRLVRLAISCTQLPTSDRPEMAKIVAELMRMQGEMGESKNQKHAREIDARLDSLSINESGNDELNIIGVNSRDVV